LLLRFLAERHRREVVDLDLEHLRAEDLLVFLDHLETKRKNTVATRNARLAAIHAFARFLATRDPEQVEQSQRLLAVPIKRGPAPLVRAEPARTITRRGLPGGQRNRRDA